ncbi:hypothetical protein cyc_06739 [Cyclospora cayetanensis]|uniref:Uncharacterized protein n=1 Tax=Cyclospora cayetanensis TaxID=88456 RepID=A0A1D3CYP1_9EIME|nr:hypothetical protein cyc_06739 [Cyclospora cayetanensis]
MRSRRRSRLFARRAAAAGEREVSVLPSRAQEAAAGAEPESRSISRAALLEDERRSTRGLPPPPKSRRSRLYRHPAQRWEAGGGPLPSLALPFQSSGHRDSPQQRLPQQQETGDSAETEAASSDGAVSYEGTPQSVRQQRQERQELRHRTHPEEARRRRQRGTLPAVSDSDESLDTSAVVTSGAAKGPPPHFEATACIRRSGVTAAAAGDPAEGAVVFLPSERRGKAQAETGGDSLESAAHVNLLDNKPQGPLSTGVLPPGAATSRLEDLAAQSAPSPAAESLTPPDASQTLGVFEEWREADDDGVPQLDAAAEEAWRSDAEAQTPPQQLQQGQLEEGDRDAEGDRDQQQLSAQKEASQPALEAARDEENPADTAVSTEDTDGRGYQTGSVTSPGGAARRLDTGALVIPPQPPHASDAAAAVAASEEVGETVSTPRAGGAQQQLVEVAVSPVRSVQRGIQTSPERAKPRQSLRNTRGASTRTRRGVPPTQLDRSSPPQLAPTPLRRYPQRTRLKPLLGWMGERIDYDWRGMVEVVRCSNILDLYLQARDVGALPDAALHTADPEKLIRRMLKQQQLVVASKEAKAALALEDQQQQRQHGLKAVEKAAESSRKRKSSKASLGSAAGSSSSPRIRPKQRARREDSFSRQERGNSRKSGKARKGKDLLKGKAFLKKKEEKKKGGNKTRKSLPSTRADSQRIAVEEPSSNSSPSSKSIRSDQVATGESASPQLSPSEGSRSRDTTPEQPSGSAERPKLDGKTLIRQEECSWRGIGPGDAMQLAVVRQGRRLVSCKLRLKAGFVKGPDNTQKKEIFGVVLSGGPLVLTVQGEDSDLLCGAFFQVAPHETWSLRNDQQDGGYAEIYIACVLLDAPTD